MEFRRLEIEKTRVNLSHLEVDDKQKELLEANLAAAKDSLAGRQVRIIELENLLEKADGQYYGANLRHQGNTADLEVVRYRLERALATNKGIDRAQRAYQRMVDKDYRFQAVAEEQLVIVEDYQQNLKELRTDVKDSERELAALLRDVAILERKLTIIDPEEMTFANKVANVFRDLPVVDFLAPSLTINQIIVKDIRDNINFTTVPKVDRCTTCHLAIDKAGYEDAPQPFTTHPHLDRYPTTASPPPTNDFGCPGCPAVGGLPLNTEPGQRQLIVDGQETTVELSKHAYRQQHLILANKSYVTPNPQQLERIGREREIIDAALTNFRDVPVDGVSLATPVEGPRSSSFGLRRFFNEQPRSPHKGMDIAASDGRPITAPRNGVVTAIGNYFFNGNTVIVDHGQGFVTLYCHMSEISVEVGQVVAAGDILGAVGATGRVTGPHLHFGTYLNGTAVDPAIFIRP